MPLRDLAQTPGPVVPFCTNCKQSDRVRQLSLDDLSPGIQYWRCELCGGVWVTRDGEDLRSASA